MPTCSLLGISRDSGSAVVYFGVLVMNWIIQKTCSGWLAIAPCRCVYGPFDYHWQAVLFIWRP
jgi:hypothetical protein